jgi:hypothetical protein
VPSVFDDLKLTDQLFNELNQVRANLYNSKNEMEHIRLSNQALKKELIATR